MIENECTNCKASISQIEFECSNCGFPISGTEKEKAVFIGRQIVNKSKIENAKTSQNKVRLILYVIGAFKLLNAFLAYNQGLTLTDCLFYIVLGLLFIVFGYLSPKKPLIFISLALILLLGYYLLIYLISPEYLFQGIIWKFVSIAFLVYGIINSLEERQLKKNNKFLKNNE